MTLEISLNITCEEGLQLNVLIACLTLVNCWTQSLKCAWQHVLVGCEYVEVEV